MTGSKQTLYYIDEKIYAKAKKYFDRLWDEASTSIAYNAVELISFEKIEEIEDELKDGEYLIDRIDFNIVREIIADAFETEPDELVTIRIEFRSLELQKEENNFEGSDIYYIEFPEKWIQNINKYESELDEELNEIEALSQTMWEKNWDSSPSPDYPNTLLIKEIKE